jgi:hypothetical protein
MDNDLPSEYRYEKRTYIQFGRKTERWCVEGATMALEFWVRPYELDGRKEYSAGVEHHSATPPPDSRSAPDHALCWCLSLRACWHDGSSLQGQEWVRWWEETGATDESVFRRLAMELTERSKKVTLCDLVNAELAAIAAKET